MTQPPAVVPAFAERLRRLLLTAAKRPGTPSAATTIDLGKVLSTAVDTDDPATAHLVAKQWLRAAMRGEQAPLLERDRPALQRLADHFEVPLDYFLEAGVAAEFDERMNIAAAAAGGGVTLIGPCRGAVQDRDAFKIYRHAVNALAAHAERRP